MWYQDETQRRNPPSDDWEEDAEQPDYSQMTADELHGAMGWNMESENEEEVEMEICEAHSTLWLVP